MPSTDSRTRQPAGITTGGQFATEARAESDVQLKTSAPPLVTSTPGIGYVPSIPIATGDAPRACPDCRGDLASPRRYLEATGKCVYCAGTGTDPAQRIPSGDPIRKVIDQIDEDIAELDADVAAGRDASRGKQTFKRGTDAFNDLTWTSHHDGRRAALLETREKLIAAATPRYAVVDGGLVQYTSTAPIEVFDLDVLDTEDAESDAVADEVRDLRTRALADAERTAPGSTDRQSLDGIAARAEQWLVDNSWPIEHPAAEQD
ncbi:hypothetical protein [Cellulosimicrobium sp. Marseille-Q4280]|uniref:hypothetical protein n=1 Tax=Cellulosimicrobium sp. Marseille-Q4280 TaxID=2937992 RepID=UPI00203B7A33|nr:hypothetical protein [Cellulosimicrobium sp. Marseille-Q4280]